jgi:hypothetical protein
MTAIAQPAHFQWFVVVVVMGMNALATSRYLAAALATQCNLQVSGFQRLSNKSVRLFGFGRA